jgi:DNA-binding HxlR family transcriptional regulator
MKRSIRYAGWVLGSDYASQNCSIARALEVVGERWTLLIIRELLYKPRRFTDLTRRLGIAKNILTNRLSKMTELGIVETVTYDDERDWNRYRLTDKGKDLFPVINALMAWGDKYEAPAGPPALFEHVCGHSAGHEMVCRSCGEPVTANNIRALPGPGFRPVEV